MHSIWIHQRFLSSASANAGTVSSETSRKAEDAKSDGGEKSGDSQQDSDARKPVRGGVKFSFFFLCVFFICF